MSFFSSFHFRTSALKGPLVHSRTVTQGYLSFVDSGFQVVDPGSLSGEFDFRIPFAVFRNPKPSIPDFWLHKQNFPDFEIRILLYGARSDISGRSRPLHWPEMSPTFFKKGCCCFAFNLFSFFPSFSSGLIKCGRNMKETKLTPHWP